MSGEESLASNQFPKVDFSGKFRNNDEFSFCKMDYRLIGIILWKSSVKDAFLFHLSCYFCRSLHETLQVKEQHLFPVEELLSSWLCLAVLLPVSFRFIMSKWSCILDTYWSPAAPLIEIAQCNWQTVSDWNQSLLFSMLIMKYYYQ